MRMSNIASLPLLVALYSPMVKAADVPAKSSMLPKVRVAADGRTFLTAEGNRFVPFGVNYFRPGTGWAPQLWKQFDAEATRQDFRRMKALGVNCVRVFLTYGSFFMKPDTLSPEGLARFDQLLAIAEAEGIYVHPTGPDHWEGMPEWAMTDRYADERALAPLETFWRLFAERYRNRNVVFAYDLLNEPEIRWDTPPMRAKWNRRLQDRCATAEKLAEAWQIKKEEIHWGDQPAPVAKDATCDRQLLDYQRFREELADEWTRRQAAAIKAADPEAMVTVGLIQWSVPALLPGVKHYSAFRPSRQAKFLDFLEIHFYPLAAGFYEYQETDELKNLAYLESVVREVAAAGKPVVVAEFGWYGGGQLTINRGVHRPATEEQQALWCRRAVETTAGLATGWLNWGLYDHREAGDVTQLTGLFTTGGKPKAWAKEFRLLAERFSKEPIPSPRLGPRPALDWDRAITSAQAAREFLEEYTRAFKAERSPR